MKITAEISEESIKEIVAPYEARIQTLREQNERLLKNAKKEANRELKDEIKQLKDRLSLSFGEFASQKELKAFKEFCKKHKHAEQMKGMEHVAGWVARYPYVIEEATGLGHMVKAVCPICGDKKDITDIRCW